VTCGWCGAELETTKVGRPPVYCCKDCRQRAFRLRRRRVVSSPAAGPLEQRRIRVAYADPPYPGLSARYYRQEPTFAGEVDHPALIASLLQDFPDGWALSTSMRALRELLPLCPADLHLCPWVKPNGVSRRTRGLHVAHEYLIVVGGRRRTPGIRDWLRAKPAIGGGDLMGRKPLAFCGFLFDALGLVVGDELVDLYPGTGIVARAWSNLCGSSATFRRPRRSREYPGDVSSSRARGEVLHDETSRTPAPAPSDETSRGAARSRGDESSPVDVAASSLVDHESRTYVPREASPGASSVPGPYPPRPDRGIGGGGPIV